jgi:hypothetical protein
MPVVNAICCDDLPEGTPRKPGRFTKKVKQRLMHDEPHHSGARDDIPVERFIGP